MYTYTVFDGFEKIMTSDLESVLVAVKKRIKAKCDSNILIFSDSTGKQMDFDLSGSEAEIKERHKIYTAKPATPQSTVGRPKLGVVPREISLLPQHWEWLNIQAGGASSTLRQLIDEKIKARSSEKSKVKQSQEITYKFLTAIAGNLPNFEESIRYLYRSDRKKFVELTNEWSKDLVEHALVLASEAFEK